jgi:ferrous-iron efflux pump FieF
MSGAHSHHGGHGHHHAHMAARGSLTQRAAIASVGMAVFLAALKLWATAQTGSVAMLGSLADTALDLIASLITLAGVRYAAMPADDEHRFGHGKAEALAALVQVGLITVSAIGIGWRAIDRWGSGARTEGLEWGVTVSLIAMTATFLLLTYQRFVIRKTGSVAIGADHVHYQTDLLLNAAVIAALVLDQLLSWRFADPLFGVAIALWLLWGAWRAATGALDQLLDREWPQDKRARFVDIVARHPELRSLHDVRTRSSGTHDFVQCHVALDGMMSVAVAHDIIERIEQDLRAEWPGLEVFIHIDPVGVIDQPDNAMIERNLLPGASA